MLKIEFKFEYARLRKKSVTHFSQFISVKVKNILREFQAQFRSKLTRGSGKMTIFLFKKSCIAKEHASRKPLSDPLLNLKSLRALTSCPNPNLKDEIRELLP